VVTVMMVTVTVTVVTVTVTVTTARCARAFNPRRAGKKKPRAWRGVGKSVTR